MISANEDYAIDVLEDRIKVGLKTAVGFTARYGLDAAIKGAIENE